MQAVHRLAALVVWLALPWSAAAFSFGTFDPGDSIAAMTLAASGGPLVMFDATSGRLTMAGEIVTIDMEAGAPFTGLSGVTFEAELDLDPLGPSFSPSMAPTLVSASFLGAASLDGFDVRILDNGPGGGGAALLRGDFFDPVAWYASGVFPVVTGSIDGEFLITGGDPDFTGALPPTAFVDWFMTAFSTPTGAVFQVCDLGNSCPTPTALGTWSSNPNAIVQPGVVPEPSTSLLLGGALAGLALLRRRSRVRS